MQLAAYAFPMTFGGASLISPLRQADQLDRAVATLAGIQLGSGFLGLVTQSEWASLQPYSVETLAIWQSARVAGERTTGSDYARHHLVLLRRGVEMLTVGDPVLFLRHALENDDPLR